MMTEQAPCKSVKKGNKWIMAAELAAVLLVSATVFTCGRLAAFGERGGHGCGGEFVLLLLPVVYYLLKQTVSDWIRDIADLWQARVPPQN